MESGGRSSSNPVILSCVTFHTLSAPSSSQGGRALMGSGGLATSVMQPVLGAEGGLEGGLEGS